MAARVTHPDQRAVERHDAYRFLAAADPVLAELVTKHGEPSPFGWVPFERIGGTFFGAVVLNVLGQQVSVVVQFILFDRLVDRLGGVLTPSGVLSLTVTELRELGLTFAKVACLHDLARRIVNGSIDIEHLDRLDDAQIVRVLTEVKGIGPWSAEMFLIDTLARPDVLPAGDLGLRKAIRAAWSLETLPTVREVRGRGVTWAPFRSYASALLWTSIGAVAVPWAPCARGSADDVHAR